MDGCLAQLAQHNITIGGDGRFYPWWAVKAHGHEIGRAHRHTDAVLMAQEYINDLIDSGMAGELVSEEAS